MFDLQKIDLGKDEAEQDSRLREYFLKTSNYENAFNGIKTIIIGRKGSGKSAIFSLLKDELDEAGTIVIPITPDQYSWSALKDYKEAGILPIQAHTNAWKLTLLASVIWKLNETGNVSHNSKLVNYYKYLKDSFVPEKDNLFFNLVDKAKNLISGIKTQWISFEWNDANIIATPLRVTEEIKTLLINEWPLGKQIRILIDRLDDSWDASDESQNLIIGLLKAANEINTTFNEKIIVTVFLRSDIYDNLFFDDQDKLRQYEETLFWNNDDLKAVICERVRVSLDLTEENNEVVWNNLFSEKLYRSKASAEKYIIDRTFKRPRDIISFVRFAIDVAIRNTKCVIEPQDTRTAEEENYSQSKYKDLIIEYKKQITYVKDLLDSFSGSLHKLSKDDLLKRLNNLIISKGINQSPEQILRYQLYVWGVIGVKRQGRAGVKQRGGARFYYYYDDPSINPLAFDDYFIHPSLRHYLNISEKREKIKQQNSDDEISEPQIFGNKNPFTEMIIIHDNDNGTAKLKHNILGEKIITENDVELKKIIKKLETSNINFSRNDTDLLGLNINKMYFYLGYLYKKGHINYMNVEPYSVEINLTTNAKEKLRRRK